MGKAEITSVSVEIRNPRSSDSVYRVQATPNGVESIQEINESPDSDDTDDTAISEIGELPNRVQMTVKNFVYEMGVRIPGLVGVDPAEPLSAEVEIESNDHRKFIVVANQEEGYSTLRNGNQTDPPEDVAEAARLVFPDF